MATQIKVNSSTGNITVQLSRGVIGPSTTANVANTAYNLDAASTANVVIGGGVNGYVLQTNGAGVTSWVAQTGGGGTVPGGSNTEIQYNDAGTMQGDTTFTFDNTTDVVSASHFSGEAGNLSNIQGANVSGAVANASHATISNSANLVAVANVTGIGNIATVNLDGNAANFLDGTGSFGPAGGGGGTYGDSNVVTLLNAFGSNTITTTGLITGDGGGLSNIAGANISGAVANATHATVADSANAVAGANVTGSVPLADLATFATTANAVAGANVSGVVANATHATTADSANAVAGANVSGEVSFAAVANSVALANVVGAGNIASINIDGNVSNVLRGDGTFSADTTDYSNSNVVSLMNAFGSNTINTTGNVTTGNLEVVGVNGNITFIPDTEIIDSQRYAKVNRATETVTLTAGSFLIDEFYTIVTTGDTDYTLIGGGTSLTAGTFNIGQTLTIISVGTTDFTLIGAPDNNIGTTFTATGAGTGTGTAGTFGPGTQFNATGVGSGTGTASYSNSSSEIYVTDDYTTQGLTKIHTYANTSSGHLAKGASLNFNSYNSIGNTNTDNLVASLIEFTAHPTSANLVGPQSGTLTTMTMGGPGADGFLTLVGSGASDAYLSGAWKQFQYRPKAMDFVRRNGNGDARTSSVADDETSLNFYNTQDRFGGGATGVTWNYPAKMGSKVDPTWVDPQTGAQGVPQGLFFNAVNTGFANIEHRMYGNGDIAFNTTGGGTPVTIGYNGVITGDGGGLSNISATAGTQIVNGTSNVSVALNSNVTVGVNSFTNVLDIGQTVTTAPAFTATTGLFTGDGGGLSNVSATATPGGFFDTIQFNNGGTLDGNSSFQFIPGSLPEVQLNGSAGSSPARLLLQDGILNIYTQDLSGGYAPFSFDTHNDLTGFMEPINYYRSRGTRAAQTAVVAGDMVKNERMQAYSGAGATLAYAGGQTSTVQANDGLGNLAVTTTISTARPANGPNSLDKILLDTEFVQTAGNIQMNNTDARFTAGRIAQSVRTFATLPASPVIGERAVISDSSPLSGITYGDVVSGGGGSAVATCYWDGSDWRAG